MLHLWPPGLCTPYALAILETAAHWLQTLQLASLPPDTTMQQLCQSAGNAARLIDLASNVCQLSTQLQQNVEVLRFCSASQMTCCVADIIVPS